MGSAGPVDVLADDLAAVVDRSRPGRGRPGHVDVAEAPALVEQVAVLGRPDGGRAALVGVGADDAAPVVDRGGEGSLRAGEVDRADAAPLHAGIRGTACGRRGSRRRSARRCCFRRRRYRWHRARRSWRSPGRRARIRGRGRCRRRRPGSDCGGAPGRPVEDPVTEPERAGRSPPAIRAPAQSEVGDTAQTQAGGGQRRLRRRSGRGRRTGRGERRENDRGGHERRPSSEKGCRSWRARSCRFRLPIRGTFPRTYARLQRARINPTLGLSSRAAEVGCTRTATWSCATWCATGTAAPRTQRPANAGLSMGDTGLEPVTVQ